MIPDASKAIDEFYESLEDTFTQIKRFVKVTSSLQYGLLFPGQTRIPPWKERKKYDTTAEDYDKYWKLCPPEKFVQQNGGVCWDYVTYIAWYFHNHFPEINYDTYYIQFDDNGDSPSHTMFIFSYMGKYYLAECSFKVIAGLYEANNTTDLINFIITEMDKHYDGAKTAGQLIKHKFWMVNYNALDSNMYGINCAGFMNYMFDHGKTFHHNYNKNFNVKKIC